MSEGCSRKIVSKLVKEEKNACADFLGHRHFFSLGNICLLILNAEINNTKKLNMLEFLCNDKYNIQYANNL